MPQVSKICMLFIAILLLFGPADGWAQHTPKRRKHTKHKPMWLKAETKSPAYILSQAVIPQTYSFIHYDKNQLYVDADSLPVFEQLKHADLHKINIVHLGDSHIQADVFSGTVRSRLQALFGMAGRGFIFPNGVAHSNNPDDFTTGETGTWTYAKNTQASPSEPLGASGFAVRTEDRDASITIKFNNPSSIAQGNRLTVWGQSGTSRFLPRISPMDSGGAFYLPDSALSAPGYWVFSFPKPITTGFILKLTQRKPAQNNFVLQGFVLENTDSSGVLYHALGVNGAKILSYLRSPLLEEHMRSLHPSLIVLDVGVNDYYAANILPKYVPDSLVSLIKHVQHAAPGANILLCSQQPNLRQTKDVVGAKGYSEVITSLGLQFSKVFAYDFYSVTKGHHSAKRWREAGLMKKDGIHLTRDGYRLKGQLFTSAFLQAYASYLAKPLQGSVSSRGIGK